MNIKDRNKILLAHMDLINTIARSYHATVLSSTCPMYDAEDLVNELIPVMARSISRYKPLKGDLRTFSRRRLHGHVLDLIRAHHHVKISRNLWAAKKEQGIDSFDQFYRPFSINRLIDEEHPDTFEDVLPCKNISVEEQVLLKEFAATCVTTFNRLKSDRTKELINAHAFHGHTLESLTDIFGLTVSRLSQITTKARKVMLQYIKRSYPQLTSIEYECIGNKSMPKPDKPLTNTLEHIKMFELIRFVAFLTKD